MTSGGPISGGVFLPVGIFAGLAMGAVSGQLMAGVLLGTAGGAAAATLVWFTDSRKRRRRHRGRDQD